MVGIYVKLILAGRKKLEEVPEHLKEEVTEKLTNLGYFDEEK